MGVSINGGTAIAGWLLREHPNLKWMIKEYHYFRKHPSSFCLKLPIGHGIGNASVHPPPDTRWGPREINR
jgi:hypothetical protein